MTRNPFYTRPTLAEFEPRLAPGDFLLGALLTTPLIGEGPSAARVARTSAVETSFKPSHGTQATAPVVAVTTPSSGSPVRQTVIQTAAPSSHVAATNLPGSFARGGVGVLPSLPPQSAGNATSQTPAPSLLGVAAQSTGPLPVGKLSMNAANATMLPAVSSLPPSSSSRPGDAEHGARAVTGSDSGNSIALDPLGNSYITGSFWNGRDTDVFVSKVTSTGTVIFTTVLINPGPDSGNAIAIDTRGNAFVAGSRKSPGGDVDAFVAKFTRNGTLFQMTTITNPGPDSGNGVAVGAGNNGFMTGSFWNGTDSDFFISRFAATTAINCSFVYPNPGADAGNAVSLDSSSNAYVTGTFSFLADNFLYLAKFDTTCGLQNGTYILNSGPNAGNGIAVNATGEGYVTGSYWNGVDSDFIIARFDAAGAFPNSFVYPNPGDDRGNAVVFDAAFNAYVTGAFTFGTDVYVYVAIFDSTTTLVNGGYIFHVGEDRGMDIVLGTGGTSFVTGAFDNGSYTDAFVAEFDASLALVDQTFIPNPN